MSSGCAMLFRLGLDEMNLDLWSRMCLVMWVEFDCLYSVVLHLHCLSVNYLCQLSEQLSLDYCYGFWIQSRITGCKIQD